MSGNGKANVPSLNSTPDSLICRDDGIKYWQGTDADVNGMLGGFPQISSVDLKGSRAFLARLGVGNDRSSLRRATRVLEGGAGIGRITLGLLVDISETVDVIEPIAKFTAALEGKPGVERVFNIGLEEWQPQADDRYDLIWNQWCVGHLTDAQLIAYLHRCNTVLVPKTGVIIVKENLSAGSDQFDNIDSSVTRSETKFKTIFKQAGLRVVHQQLQNGFPQGLYRVMMYALKPSGNCT